MTDGTLSDMIRKFEDHPSIMKIGENINKNSKPKSQSHKDISTKIIEDNRDIFSNLITDNFNSGIYKKVEFKTVFKNNSRTNKNNYGPVSVLPAISKLYDRLIWKTCVWLFGTHTFKMSVWFQRGL